MSVEPIKKNLDYFKSSLGGLYMFSVVPRMDTRTYMYMHEKTRHFPTPSYKIEYKINILFCFIYCFIEVQNKVKVEQKKNKWRKTI